MGRGGGGGGGGGLEGEVEAERMGRGEGDLRYIGLLRRKSVWLPEILVIIIFMFLKT